MTYRLGLTGSIGMGKSTTAQMFVDEGCALWDADAAVHRLYSKGGAAVLAIREKFPQVIQDSAVSRELLKKEIAKDAAALAQIEKIVHPLVQMDREKYLSNSSADITVLDIPLLFETNANSSMDAVVCVTVSEDTQKQRVMQRETMTEAQFDLIKSKQLSDEEKRNRSDYVIVTDTRENALRQVQEILREIREKLANA